FNRIMSIEKDEQRRTTPFPLHAHAPALRELHFFSGSKSDPIGEATGYRLQAAGRMGNRSKEIPACSLQPAGRMGNRSKEIPACSLQCAVGWGIDRRSRSEPAACSL